jgi:hypothetical protein
MKTKFPTYTEYSVIITMPVMRIPRYRMLRSLAFFVLYVFMIWGMTLALTINDPVIPKISNIEIIPFLDCDIEKPPFHKQTGPF